MHKLLIEDSLIKQVQQRQQRAFEIAFNLQNEFNMNKPEEKPQETNLKDPPTSSDSAESKPTNSRNIKDPSDNDDSASLSSNSNLFTQSDSDFSKIEESTNSNSDNIINNSTHSHELENTQSSDDDEDNNNEPKKLIITFPYKLSRPQKIAIESQYLKYLK